MSITAKSSCLPDKSWSPSLPFPPGPLAFPPTLEKPDGPDMFCKQGHCKPLNLTYNPNEEAGAEFHCKIPLKWEEMPVKVEPSNQCHLLCDKMLVAVVGCEEGEWTGKPKQGFWCSKEREGVGHWEEKIQGKY